MKVNVSQKVKDVKGNEIGLPKEYVVLESKHTMELVRDNKGNPLVFIDDKVKNPVILGDVCINALDIRKEGMQAKDYYKNLDLAERIHEAQEKKGKDKGIVEMDSDEISKIVRKLPETTYSATIIGRVYQLLNNTK